jgi:hypothetical protein
MFSIQSFLDQWTRVRSPEREAKETIILSIHVICGFFVRTEECMYRDGDIICTVRPAFKNEIILHKKEILGHARATRPDIRINDIR